MVDDSLAHSVEKLLNYIVRDPYIPAEEKVLELIRTAARFTHQAIKVGDDATLEFLLSEKIAQVSGGVPSLEIGAPKFLTTDAKPETVAQPVVLEVEATVLADAEPTSKSRKSYAPRLDLPEFGSEKFYWVMFSTFEGNGRIKEATIRSRFNAMKRAPGLITRWNYQVGTREVALPRGQIANTFFDRDEVDNKLLTTIEVCAEGMPTYRMGHGERCLGVTSKILSQHFDCYTTHHLARNIRAATSEQRLVKFKDKYYTPEDQVGLIFMKEPGQFRPDLLPTIEQRYAVRLSEIPKANKRSKAKLVKLSEAERIPYIADEQIYFLTGKEFVELFPGIPLDAKKKAV